AAEIRVWPLFASWVASERDPLPTRTMIRFHDITAAAERIAGRVHRTPLLSARTLGKPCGTRLFLKAEAMQKTGSFEERSALNRVDTLNDAARARELIAVSAGNHAQAVAYAARDSRTRCTVVMSDTAPMTKIAA